MGQLLANTDYHLSWRQFFAYDVFEPDIDCENFGAVTVRAASFLLPRDNAFFIGRDADLRHSLMS